MVQQLTITLESEVPLKSLIESALQSEAKMLAVGLRRTRERLAQFEKQFEMTSAEFERKLASREIAETLDFIDWQGEIAMLKALESKERALQWLKIA